MASTKTRLFYAEAAKGYIIKVMIDVLANSNIQRGYFSIDKNKISLRQNDQNNTILYDYELPRKNCKGYFCKTPMTISINLKHAQSVLRNVKKKDFIAMSIDSALPGKFSITIKPEGTKENTRSETNSIAYQEEKDYVTMSFPEGGYKHPMVISAPDFQKIKRLTTIGKQVIISIQKNNYLSFKCDVGTVFDSELIFGEINDDPQDSDDEGLQVEPSKPIQPPSSTPTTSYSSCPDCSKPPEECWCECDVCGEYKCDCTCTCDVCGEYKCDCVCTHNKKSVPDEKRNDTKLDVKGVKGLFAAPYYSSILTKLIKLPGLCTQLQFYAPTISGYPLMIEANAGQGGYSLGTIKVFIKDVNQITFEASISNESDEVVAVKKTKGKKNIL